MYMRSYNVGMQLAVERTLAPCELLSLLIGRFLVPLGEQVACVQLEYLLLLCTKAMNKADVIQ